MPLTPAISLAAVAAFKGLTPADLALLEARLSPLFVHAGTALVFEGGEADALYVVVSGRFRVEVLGQDEPVAEITGGGTIGEIAFFAGGQRTATCRAIRDSVVVRLTRADFDAISTRAPEIWSNITATLAQRLAAETRKSARLRGTPMPRPRPRTIALVRAGPAPLPQGALSAILKAAQARPGTLVLDADAAREQLAWDAAGSLDAAQTLNELERGYETVIYVAEETLTPWSEQAIRQADEIVLVGWRGDTPLGAPVALNALEEFSFALEGCPRHRLALLHPRRNGVQGTRHWLAGRRTGMHHHLSLGDMEDAQGLWRFVRGEALGYVACGGGAYCAAHIGLYKAFRESGTRFDVFGGASGGAAMAAAFAEDIDPAVIDARVHQIFIEGKAMARYTLPRYGLLDHTHFDRHLQAQYGNTLIEDLWTPYFAVTFDLTDVALQVIRTGPVWAAIRASAAIPGVLPPYIDARGHLLVDGSVAANVPIDVMHQLKAGPNVVVTFDAPQGVPAAAAYDALPGRRDLIWRSLNPWARDTLPEAPSAATVLVRSLMANRNHFERQLEASDWLLMPPVPAAMGALDWRRHSELVDLAYRYAVAEIAARGPA